MCHVASHQSFLRTSCHGTPNMASTFIRSKSSSSSGGGGGASSRAHSPHPQRVHAGPLVHTRAAVQSRRCLHLARTAAAAAAAAVGIDLGTTNSVVAILRRGDAAPTILTDAQGAFTIPSVVAYDAAGSVLVGQAAKQKAAANPANTFYSAKRLIGRRLCDVRDLRLAYGVADDGQGGVALACPAMQALLSPQQVSAEVLRHLLELASQALGGEMPQQVVVTVPAYFSQQQRAATLEAARLAGITKVSLLQEPVAAAMAFGFGKPTDAETLLVFDLGGGTFDLSVVDSFEGIMEVLATNGDGELGGDDFDRSLVDWLLKQQQQQQQQQGASSSSTSSGSGSGSEASLLGSLDPEQLAAALAVVEAAKCQLSSHEAADIDTSGIFSSGSAGQQLRPPVMVLTRQQMHAATAALRERLWQPLQPLAEDCKLEYECQPSSIEQQLLQGEASQCEGQLQQQQQQQAAVAPAASSNGNHSPGAAAATAAAQAAADPYAPKPRKLTAVLLVGGATRMPIIQRGLQLLTGLQPRSEVDPEQAVALGAAIQAAVLLGLSSGLELMDGSYVQEQHSRSTGIQ